MASNSETVEELWETYGQNFDGIVTLERGVTGSDTMPPVFTSMTAK